MSEDKKKYYVRWVETHEIEVEADSEDAAIEKALKQSSKDNRDGTERSIAIAA